MSDQNPDDKLKKLVNSSGFPLQIGLVHHIASKFIYGDWKVILSEHPWKLPSASDNGFIDLVVEDKNRTQIMVVECKRVRDTEWVFLVPKGNPNLRSHANNWFTLIQSGNTKRFFWTDLSSSPPSYQSEYCIVHGQDPKSKPMLERIASELIDSTEALAFEEHSIHKDDTEFLRIYFNVIVTTAELKICKFEPSDIDVSTGEISNTKFEIVPWMRFVKSFTSRPVTSSTANTISESAKANERTVFVVNADKFVEFLSEWDLGDIPKHFLK